MALVVVVVVDVAVVVAAAAAYVAQARLIYYIIIIFAICMHLRNLRAQFSQHLHKHFTDFFFSHGIIRTHTQKDTQTHARIVRERASERARAKSNTLRGEWQHFLAY